MADSVVPDMRAGYDLCQNKFYDFLDHYILPEADIAQSSRMSETTTSQTSTDPGPHYVGLLEQMRLAQQTTLWVDWQHVREYDCDLADFISDFYYRVELRLRKALQNLVRQHMEDYLVNEEDQTDREFWVAFYNLTHPEKLRNLKTKELGKLRAFSGTVTRTTEVRPELFLGTFKCMECNTVVRDIAQQFKWTTPTICANQTCGNRRKWDLMRDESTFCNWQKIKVQESSDEVPAGSLPRSLDVIVRNDAVERCRAGDTMLFVGTLIAIPDVAALTAPGERVQTRPGRVPNGFQGGQGVSGLKQLGCRELHYRLGFLACATQEEDINSGQVSVRSHDDATVDEVYDSYTDDQQNDLDMMKTNGDIYKDLTRSVAPQVFGHDDIKRAVLLMLFGGVHKQTKEGINLRGDINIAIVGDPSCAKSQILKYISKFLPRAVYTSGKSSSAAGLTASVTKDVDSNEFCIEAGALMLADNGICCIDEFDKMDTKDQVAIHEAMEQQTISIAKAGIQASLNARTSILAAANPLGGRYDKNKPLKYNVGLPPAILSRFDLLHVMIDEPDEDVDRAVANHIVGVHQKRERAFNVPYSMGQVQRYIKYARAITPRMTPQAKTVLVESYKQLRTGDAAPGTQAAYRITVRQLEALVRLSEAHARVRCDDWIHPRDVREAKRLVRNSILSVDITDAQMDDEEFVEDAADVEDFVRAHRDGGDASGSGAGEASRQQATDTRRTRGRAGRSQAAAPAQPAQGGARASGAQPAAEPAAQPPQKQGTKVSQKKVHQVKTLLLRRLTELQEEEAERSAEAVEPGTTGTSQHDLLTWYFNHMIEQKAFSSTEEVTAEFVLVGKIVQHLIRRDSALVVIESPSRNEGEEHDAFAKRQQRERVLAINPNYAPE